MSGKIKHVEVRACKDEVIDSETTTIVWTTEADAHFFGVYEGEPGAFLWVADFGNKLDACYWGRERAMRLGAEFRNRIGEV